MIDLERSTQPETAGSVGGRTVRGGWLCDEMGMGKTAVVTALCLANPPAASEGKAVVTGGNSSSASTLKLTLVIVNNTLVKQWEDEVKRFAPALRVHSLYQGAGQGRAAALRNLEQVDVLITTPHAKWPVELGENSSMHIHRLIIDESHLLGGKSWKGLTYKFLRIRANHVWCVTGTPFSAGLPDLDSQARLLGHWTSGAYLSTKINNCSNEQLVTLLRTLMIRHVKAQRIGVEIALALPDASSETMWLQMSSDEQLLYTLHACYDGKPAWSGLITHVRNTPHKLEELEHGLSRRRDATCHVYSARAVAKNGDVENNCDPMRAAVCAAFLRMHTKGTPAVTTSKGTPMTNEDNEDSKWKVRPEKCTKYQALLDDMAALREREPQCKVVVFTSRSRVQQDLVALIKTSPKAGAENWSIFEFNRDTPPLRRHRRIHDFQNSVTDKPCVFVVTYETAAVGITLTAATRVYLMEPAIDPAQACHTLPTQTTQSMLSARARPRGTGGTGGRAHPPSRSDQGNLHKALRFQGLPRRGHCHASRQDQERRHQARRPPVPARSTSALRRPRRGAPAYAGSQPRRYRRATVHGTERYKPPERDRLGLSRRPPSAIARAPCFQQAGTRAASWRG